MVRQDIAYRGSYVNPPTTKGGKFQNMRRATAAVKAAKRRKRKGSGGRRGWLAAWPHPEQGKRRK